MTDAELASLALDEDLGPGDLTTQATVPRSTRATGRVLAKQDLIVAGHDIAAAVFAQLDARLGTSTAYQVLVGDGEAVAAGTVIATTTGSAMTLLTGERCALNFLMRMCGIATHVRAYADAAGADGPRIVDTRKTTALHRRLEKYAVRCGGGHNHRHGLYDGVMIKDNHITAVGSLSEVVLRVREQVHHLVRIEVEASTLDEVDEALATDAEVILLDNMDDEMLAEAVRRARGTRPVVLEASGNITPARIAAIRDLGLDVVSAGGLIHQATWADLSMKIRTDAVA